MQITGQNHLSVDPATAWAAFHDEGVLERTLPGAQRVSEEGPGRYAITVTAGVAAIKGTYDGQAVFSEEEEPASFLLSLSGSGGPGTINADVRLRLSDDGEGGTGLDWTADAVVGGPVGGVGQRMLSSVAKRLAGQFFTNIDRDLTSGGGGQPEGGEDAGAAGVGVSSTEDGGMPSPAGAGAPARTGSGPRHTATPPSTAAGTSVELSDTAGQLVPMLAGAAIALAGVAVGARLRRR